MKKTPNVQNEKNVKDSFSYSQFKIESTIIEQEPLRGVSLLYDTTVMENTFVSPKSTQSSGEAAIL